MKQVSLFFLAIFFIFFTSCTSTQIIKPSKPSEKINNISIFQISSPALAAQYENQIVRFKAKFGKMFPGFGIGGMEKYQKTHVPVSLTSDDGEIKLFNVLIPASEQLLPNLKSGDLLEIEGIPHNEKGIYVYFVVLHLKKL